MSLAIILIGVVVSWPAQAFLRFTPMLQASQENSSQQPPANPSSASPPAAPAPETSKPNAPPKTPGKKPPRKKSAGQTAAGPSKRVVRDGSAPDPTVQIAPGESQKQASNQLQNTNELLADTEGNLKTIAERGPTASQQSAMRQIRQYMDQAKQAADQGDQQRAHNLALKAHLLSMDLLKH